MRRTLPAVLAVALGSAPAGAQAVSCPAQGSGGQVAFADGSLAMRTDLAVNPDGAAGSYVPGDHGYTYVANGVNLKIAGGFLSCSGAGNSGRCRRDWLQAEALGFAAGSPQFCVFAMEVAPMSAGGARTPCQKPGRFLVGGGKGRPVLAPPFPAAAGGTIRPYLSTTSLRQRVSGVTSYIDSAAVPALVVPTSRPQLVGAVAWVRYQGRDSFAIVGDTGPAFGEGSVALHQKLRHGTIGPAQPVGPIPKAQRCQSAETSLKLPFQSRPDVSGDRCQAGHVPQGATDIRAYGGIGDRAVDSVILAQVKPPMQGSIVTQAVTPASLEALAAAAGFTRARLAAMADCAG